MAIEIEGLWYSDEMGRPHLDLGADGSAIGSDGCNVIHSTYTREGSRVAVAPSLSTMKACVGVDTWLSKVATLDIEGREATVKNRAGETIGVLVREP